MAGVMLVMRSRDSHFWLLLERLQQEGIVQREGMATELCGMQVMGMLGIQGKQVGSVVEQITDWQLANPSASAQECKDWLEASRGSVLAAASAALEA